MMDQQKMRQRAKNTRDHSDYYYLSKITNQQKALKKLLNVAEYRLVEKYEHVMINESLADATRCKHMETILSLTRILGKKQWLTLSSNDIELLVVNVMRKHSDNGQETNTTYDHKKILKIFFRWLKLGSRSFRDVGNPPELKNVKLKQVKDKIVREDLITEDDIRNMLAACAVSRDKAFLHVHYEAGTRPGEILSLKLKHVTSDKYGMKINVDGKTGARPIRLVESVPTLSKWLADHPNKNDPESPLWVHLTKNRYGQKLSYVGATQILNKACRNAQMNKRINLKLFRHSEATRTAAFMPESTLRKRHGWSPTSKMPSKYAHINQSDVEDSILAHYGIKKEDPKIKRTPLICPGCKNPNSFDAEICDNCSRPLSLEKAFEIEEKDKQEKENLASSLKEIKKRLDKVDRRDKILAEMSRLDKKLQKAIKENSDDVDELKDENIKLENEYEKLTDD